jgi:hypothetical protein
LVNVLTARLPLTADYLTSWWLGNLGIGDSIKFGQLINHMTR